MKMLKVLLVLLVGVSAYAVPNIIYTSCSPETAANANAAMQDIEDLEYAVGGPSQSANAQDKRFSLLKAFKEDKECSAQSVRKLINDGLDVDMRDPKTRNMTLLMIAAMKGRTEVVKTLLEKKADIKATADGYTALMLACMFGHKGVVDAFIQAHNEGTINIYDTLNQTRGGEGGKLYTALSYACSSHKAAEETKKYIKKKLGGEPFFAKDTAGTCCLVAD